KAIPNSCIKQAPNDFRICCSLLNFLKKGGWKSDETNPAVIHRINSRVDKPNLLANLVKNEQLIRRSSKFESREAIHEQPLDYGFPKLTQNELEIFCCGTYQLKMANSYYAEHIKTNGRYKFFIDKDGCDLDYEGAGIT